MLQAAGPLQGAVSTAERAREDGPSHGLQVGGRAVPGQAPAGAASRCEGAAGPHGLRCCAGLISGWQPVGSTMWQSGQPKWVDGADVSDVADDTVTADTVAGSAETEVPGLALVDASAQIAGDRNPADLGGPRRPLPYDCGIPRGATQRRYGGRPSVAARGCGANEDGASPRAASWSRSAPAVLAAVRRRGCARRAARPW